MLAAYDNRRLGDQREALLDPISERRPSGRQKCAYAKTGVVACGERKQRPRFPRRITQPSEELVARSAPLRIDRRTDEDHRSHAPWQAHGELRDDLAAHRIRHERRAPNSGRVQPAGERDGKICDAERRGRPLTTPVPGQIRCEHREGGGERPCEREHVRARDPVPVYQHDGWALPAYVRVDAEAKYFEPPALDRRTNTQSRVPFGG